MKAPKTHKRKQVSHVLQVANMEQLTTMMASLHSLRIFYDVTLTQYDGDDHQFPRFKITVFADEWEQHTLPGVETDVR